MESIREAVRCSFPLPFQLLRLTHQPTVDCCCTFSGQEVLPRICSYVESQEAFYFILCIASNYVEFTCMSWRVAPWLLLILFLFPFVSLPSFKGNWRRWTRPLLNLSSRLRAHNFSSIFGKIWSTNLVVPIRVNTKNWNLAFAVKS